MIDPITAFSAVSTAANAISRAVKAGRDLNSLGHQIAKYATAEADLQFGESKKKQSRFSFTEDKAIAAPIPIPCLLYTSDAADE